MKETITVPKKSIENCIDLLNEDGKNSKKTAATILKNWIEINEHLPNDELTEEAQKLYERILFRINLYIEPQELVEEVINLIDELIEEVKK